MIAAGFALVTAIIGRVLWFLDGIDRSHVIAVLVGAFLVGAFVGGYLHLRAWNAYGHSIAKWIPAWKRLNEL